jgi:transcriptional regulator with XRE-family HTH domain
LAETLQRVRALKDMSLKTVADKAGVSAAYLQKLENAEVQSPSPHRLLSVATALGVPYADLMRLAGYLVEDKTGRAPSGGASTLAHAMNAGTLTDDEINALAEYLQFLRTRKPRSP